MDNFDPWQGIAIHACNATNMQSHQFDAQAIWKQAVLADQRANKASNLSIPGRGDLCQPQLHGNTTPAPENNWQLQADTTVDVATLGLLLLLICSSATAYYTGAIGSVPPEWRWRVMCVDMARNTEADSFHPSHCCGYVSVSL